MPDNNTLIKVGEDIQNTVSKKFLPKLIAILNCRNFYVRNPSYNHPYFDCYIEGQCYTLSKDSHGESYVEKGTVRLPMTSDETLSVSVLIKYLETANKLRMERLEKESKEQIRNEF